MLRNLIDRTLTNHVARVAPHVTDWLWDLSWLPTAGHKWDKRTLDVLETARNHAGGHDAPHGATIAELSFGFWRYVLAGRYEESFWNTALDVAFIGIPGHEPGDRRRHLEQSVVNLHGLRNRLAHYEPIAKPWTRPVPGGIIRTFTLDDLYNDLKQVLAWATPTHAESLLATSRVPELLVNRPT